MNDTNLQDGCGCRQCDRYERDIEELRQRLRRQSEVHAAQTEVLRRQNEELLNALTRIEACKPPPAIIIQQPSTEHK